jgi:hypothetical protein
LVSAQFSWWKIITAVGRFNDYLHSEELSICPDILGRVYLPFLLAQRKMREYSYKAVTSKGKRMSKKLSLCYFYLYGPLAQGISSFVPELAEKEVIDWSGNIRDAAAILASVAPLIFIINQVK